MYFYLKLLDFTFDFYNLNLLATYKFDNMLRAKTIHFLCYNSLNY